MIRPSALYGLYYFLALILISHLALPAIQRQEILPFFNWRVFDDVKKIPYNDLRIHLTDRTFLFTEGDPTLRSLARRRLWYLLQSQPASLRPTLSSFVPDQSLRGIEVCQILTDLPSYILSTEKQNWLSCHEL